MDIREQHRLTKERNLAQLRAKPVKVEPPCEETVIDLKQSYLLTLYEHVYLRGKLVRQFMFRPNRAIPHFELLAHQTQYFENIPLGRQIISAGISYSLSLERHSSFVLSLDDNDFLMVQMMITRDHELVKFEDTPQFRKGVAVRSIGEEMYKRWR